MINAIKEAVKEIDEEIDELNKQKQMIQKLDVNSPMTESLWHEICETPLRYSNEVLTAIVRNMFPNAENIVVHCNYVYFKLYGFNVQIPTYRGLGINVDMTWYHTIPKPKEYASSTEIQKKADYFKAVDNHADWKTKAKILVPNGDKMKTVPLFFSWLFSHKYTEKERTEFEKDYADICKLDEERKKKYQNNCKEQHEQAVLLKEKVLPEINKFSTMHRPYNETNCYGMTIEKTLKAENLL